MLVVIYALLLWGVVVIYSIGPVLSRATDISVTKQLIALIISTGAFWFASRMKPDFWRRILPLVMLAAIVTTLLLLIPGGIITSDSNGASRWLEMGGVSFQPAELLKLALILYFAVFLASRMRRDKMADRKSTLIPASIILGVTAIFVAGFQKDLGTMMVIASIIFVMLYVAGLPKKDLTILAALGTVGVTVLILFAPHRLQRVTTLISPDLDPAGSGYHIQQSLIAIGSGGPTGLGVGQSIQAFGYLPEVANDSIFAIHAETVGFVGILILMLALAYLLRRIHLQALAATTDYHRLILIGIFTWILAHIVINIGAMLGLVPLTGITLPLLSYGGSSMVLIMLALGIVFQLSRYSQIGVINSETGNNRTKV